MYTMVIELSREPNRMEIREINHAIVLCEPFVIEHTYGTNRWLLHVGEKRGRALIARSYYGGAKGMRLCCGTEMRLIEG